mmetsp:Transcript_8590/g.14095  ORF Transcript_8590/g.14095 Transcript_8590/m.14095 type:complete len:367 (+) Transcript_8590:4359-5459(+)
MVLAGLLGDLEGEGGASIRGSVVHRTILCRSSQSTASPGYRMVNILQMAGTPLCLRGSFGWKVTVISLKVCPCKWPRAGEKAKSAWDFHSKRRASGVWLRMMKVTCLGCDTMVSSNCMTSVESLGSSSIVTSSIYPSPFREITVSSNLLSRTLMRISCDIFLASAGQNCTSNECPRLLSTTTVPVGKTNGEPDAHDTRTVAGSNPSLRKLTGNDTVLPKRRRGNCSSRWPLGPRVVGAVTATAGMVPSPLSSNCSIRLLGSLPSSTTASNMAVKDCNDCGLKVITTYRCSWVGIDKRLGSTSNPSCSIDDHVPSLPAAAAAAAEGFAAPLAGRVSACAVFPRMRTDTTTSHAILLGLIILMRSVHV